MFVLGACTANETSFQFNVAIRQLNLCQPPPLLGVDKLFLFFWPIIPFEYSCKCTCCPLFL